MRFFDELIANNQSNALAQMAQDPAVSRRLAGPLKDVPTSVWSNAAKFGLAGLMAVGVVLSGVPLEAHAQENVYQQQEAQQYQGAQYQTAQTAQYQQPSNNGSGVGTVLATAGGGAAGGFVGNQFGAGNGKKAMTILGALGGAIAGHAVATANDAPRQTYANPAAYSENNPNPYPDQPPAEARPKTGLNIGTGIGAGIGALAGHFIGKGGGNIAAMIVGAGLGAVGGTIAENKMFSPNPNYMNAQAARDESGACFQQWNGHLVPTQPLSANPMASTAMRESVTKLGESFDGYTGEGERYRQIRQNAQWAVSVVEQNQQQQALRQENQTMVQAEKRYVYYRGTFLEKCNLAAQQGYDVRNFAQAQELLHLDTGGYTYRSANPAVTAQAAYKTGRPSGY